MHCLCEKLSCKAATESQIVVMQGEFRSGISAGGRARLQRRKPQRGLRSVVLRTRPTLSLRQPAARPTSPGIIDSPPPPLVLSGPAASLTPY